MEEKKKKKATTTTIPRNTYKKKEGGKEDKSYDFLSFPLVNLLIGRVVVGGNRRSNSEKIYIFHTFS